MRQNTDKSQHHAAALNYRDPAFSKHGSSPQLRLTFDINWINFSSGRILSSLQLVGLFDFLSWHFF